MTDPLPAPVARAIDAVNAGDSDAFLTEFASDGWIDDNGRRFVGLVQRLRLQSAASVVAPLCGSVGDAQSVEDERVGVCQLGDGLVERAADPVSARVQAGEGSAGRRR